jgi:hypothetical protein
LLNDFRKGLMGAIPLEFPPDWRYTRVTARC